MLDRVSFGARPPNLFAVIAGLDLAIHDGLQRQNQYGLRRRSRIMDARVKPAHDAESVVHTIGA
jgi:hypothetical protein